MLKNRTIFLSSVFFVLGFSSVFSLVGVLLQTVLLYSSLSAMVWFGRIGGVIIILFGLFLLGLFTPKFLMSEHTFAVRRFRSQYLTSFIFGAAFAVGWTPCVSAALGAILGLAATAPSSAFFLLFVYTLGLGIPFLLVGLFTDKARTFIARAGKWLLYIQYVFGGVLIVIGVLIFVGELSRVANFAGLAGFLNRLNLITDAGSGIDSLNLINAAVAFFAGLGSFLSPCILPILPGFLSYLASTSVVEARKL